MNNDEIKHLEDLDELAFEVRSPLQHLEQKSNSLRVYLILPIFTFANALVVIRTDYDFNFSLMINIDISLFAGKFVGVVLFSYLCLKLKITELPSGLTFDQILDITAIAGVGFTM